MRPLDDLLTAVPFAVVLPGPADGRASVSPSWLVGCHGLLYNLALIVPSVIFVAYLAFLARRSFAKLTNGYSYVMIAYYALIWLISVLNLLWCLVQVRHFSSSLVLRTFYMLIELSNLITVCYHSLYLPLLYVIFLADFFQVCFPVPLQKYLWFG
ncbi:hypothetical protein B296_00005194 [Ensete ventricosum]|uniref:Uncharacterized protein n=1 Tax=Ensete ventricosum TaxID=4639 RepID=A0A427ASZ9_ENSVE|nr:hypothetical protein B296_00005194 [Ensete ventricosum]